MKEELNILRNYLKLKKLKNTKQREKVLEVFLSNEGHLSVDELYHLVKKKYPEIGHSTVFRSIKTMADAGLAAKVRSNCDLIKYEHSYKHKDHGHLVCLKCGKMFEFEIENIKKELLKISKKENFLTKKYSIKILGICSKCQKNK